MTHAACWGKVISNSKSELDFGWDYPPVDEESCKRERSEGKVDKVVREELWLPFDVLFFAVGDHVVEGDVPEHVQQAADHTKYQDPN